MRKLPHPERAARRHSRQDPGRRLRHQFGKAITPNITPDKETGIGNRTDEQLIRAISGVSPSGRPLLPPMPWPYYAGKIADGDMKAIVAYLRSLKPIKNKVPAPEPPKRP